MKRAATLLGLVGALVLIASSLVLAMSSTSYRLDWYVPAIGGGGGPSESGSYAANLTVGQTARGSSANGSYGVGLGYWYGIDTTRRIYLPLILAGHAS